jgi:transaldolase
MERLCELHAAGGSIWLDTLSRHLVASGEFGSLIDDACVTGATSNPTIFAAAIRGAAGASVFRPNRFRHQGVIPMER